MLSAHIHLLPALSAERIAAELRRLMAGPAALAVLCQAADMGIDQILFGAQFTTDVLASELLARFWRELVLRSVWPVVCLRVCELWEQSA